MREGGNNPQLVQKAAVTISSCLQTRCRPCHMRARSCMAHHATVSAEGGARYVPLTQHAIYVCVDRNTNTQSHL